MLFRQRRKGFIPWYHSDSWKELPCTYQFCNGNSRFSLPGTSIRELPLEKRAPRPVQNIPSLPCTCRQLSASGSVLTLPHQSHFFLKPFVILPHKIRLCQVFFRSFSFSSSTVSPSSGCRIQGAIWQSGSSTKDRRCISRWGI